MLIAEQVASRFADTDPMHLSTVVAGRRLIADTAAMLPLVASREATNERITPTPTILRRPDPAEPRRATIEKLCNSLTRHGNAWLAIIARDTAGQPLAVRVLDPARVAWQLDDTGERLAAVWYNGRDVPLSEVRLIPFAADQGPIGSSPLREIGDTLGAMVGVLSWAASYYADGGPVPYALRHPTALPPDTASKLLDQWLEARRSRRPALLSGSWSIEQFDLPSASDALMVDALDYLDAAIGRALLIPPSLLNLRTLSSLTYATSVAETQRWLTLGLYPGYLNRIEAAFSDLLPRGTQALFDTSNLLRTNQAERIATLAQSIAAGIHTPDEARVLEGLPSERDSDLVPIAPNVEGI